MQPRSKVSDCQVLAPCLCLQLHRAGQSLAACLTAQSSRLPSLSSLHTSKRLLWHHSAGGSALGHSLLPSLQLLHQTTALPLPRTKHKACHTVMASTAPASLCPGRATLQHQHLAAFQQERHVHAFINPSGSDIVVLILRRNSEIQGSVAVQLTPARGGRFHSSGPAASSLCARTPPEVWQRWYPSASDIKVLMVCFNSLVQGSPETWSWDGGSTQQRQTRRGTTLPHLCGNTHAEATGCRLQGNGTSHPWQG